MTLDQMINLLVTITLVEMMVATGLGVDIAPLRAALARFAVDERAARHLANQAGGAADGQGKPDVFGCPPMYRQVGGGNRPKGGLHAGQKEVEPAQGKQALV